jgi:hypothetical protein
MGIPPNGVFIIRSLYFTLAIRDMKGGEVDCIETTASLVIRIINKS